MAEQSPRQELGALRKKTDRLMELFKNLESLDYDASAPKELKELALLKQTRV